MISTRCLSLLPDVNGLRRTLQSMAMLDAIMSPEWEYRYYSFNSAWAQNEQMGSMRNGSGDDFFAHFSSAGCWIKGFVHDALMSPYRTNPPKVWPGILDSVPAGFSGCLREPAFTIDDTTFCIWRQVRDQSWQLGSVQFPRGSSDPDGSEDLLSPLDSRPETYRAWAAEYYEQDVDLSAVEHIYSHQPLTADVAGRLKSDIALADLSADIHEIGYPVNE